VLLDDSFSSGGRAQISSGGREPSMDDAGELAGERPEAPSDVRACRLPEPPARLARESGSRSGCRAAETDSVPDCDLASFGAAAAARRRGLRGRDTPPPKRNHRHARQGEKSERRADNSMRTRATPTETKAQTFISRSRASASASSSRQPTTARQM
jgi:hypothetical protein